ncbi:MAG TPA: hypothetical protein VF240_20705 [Pyrinomonadaceae bacterium]
MSQEFEDELSAEERRALDALVREKTALPLLEERVVGALKRAELLRPAKSIRGLRAPRVGLAVAASLLFFVLGTLAGARWGAGAPERKTGVGEFMLVLRSAAGQSQPDAPDEVRRRVGEYGKWAGRLRQQGVRVDGEKLRREARILRAADGSAAVSEERSEASQDAIAGYFLIEAQNYEQAVKVAEGCPHLKYGGTIEIRQIDRF